MYEQDANLITFFGFAPQCDILFVTLNVTLDFFIAYDKNYYINFYLFTLIFFEAIKVHHHKLLMLSSHYPSKARIAL